MILNKQLRSNLGAVRVAIVLLISKGLEDFKNFSIPNYSTIKNHPKDNRAFCIQSNNPTTIIKLITKEFNDMQRAGHFCKCESLTYQFTDNKTIIFKIK